MNCAVKKCRHTPVRMLTVARLDGLYCAKHAKDLDRLQDDGTDLRDVTHDGRGWHVAQGAA